MMSARPVVRFIASALGQSGRQAATKKNATRSSKKKANRGSAAHPPNSPLIGTLQLSCIVKPNSRRGDDAILAIRQDGIELCVRAPPKDGQANTAVRELIAKVLSVPKSSVEIDKGKTSPQKLVIVHNFSTTGQAENATSPEGAIIESTLSRLNQAIID